MRLRIGCAGWSYRDWVGPVYPTRSRPADWLDLYASLFDTVEIDATFYALPSERTVAGWAARGRDLAGFAFSAKLPQDATHRALPDGDLPEARRVAKTFLARVVQPLEAVDRFEAAVVQLPPAFAAHDPRSGREPLPQLVELVETLQPKRRRVAVEFRNRSWFRADGRLLAAAEDALADTGAAVARIDGLGSTITPSRTATWSYYRLHGRRATIPPAERGESWAPYNYLYSSEEIAEIAATIRFHAAEDERTTVIFNNHYAGKAAQNAADLGETLGRPRPRLPAAPVATRRLEDFNE